MSTLGAGDALGSIDGPIGTIVLNRPERLNAISDEMLEELARLLSMFEADPRVLVVVLKGAGSAFCAGGDLKDFDARGGEGDGQTRVDPATVANQQRVQRATVGRIFAFTKPVIASVVGPVAGAGLGFALASDFRVASTSAVMVAAFGGVGLSGDFGVTWLLRSLIGPARAAEVLMLNSRLTAEDCLRLGLLTEVVEPERLSERTTALAISLADMSPLALRHMKMNLRHGIGDDFVASMDFEVVGHKECGISDFHIRAVRRFLRRQANSRDAT